MLSTFFIWDIGRTIHQPVPGQARQFGHYLCAIRQVPGNPFKLRDFCSNEEPIPITLQKMIGETFAPVEEPTPQKIAVQEISECADLERNSVIDVVLQET